MKVQKRHLHIALVILLLAAAYSVWTAFKPTPRVGTIATSQQPLMRSEEPAVAASRTVVDPLSIPAPPAIDLQAAPAGGRDPFLFGDERRDGYVRPVQRVRTADPMVKTILYSASRQSAIVENKMVSVGDNVGTLKVVEIARDAVVFASSDGERRRVSVYRAAPAGLTR
jgi:hypothetical protein